MGYVMDLRKKIGHSPILMASACVLVLNTDGQLLLQKRADNHFWGYPGGALELGESFEECAKREVFEETGLECLELHYFTHKSGEEMHYTYPNGDEVYIAEMVFVCNRYKGEMSVQKSEATEQRFFDLDNLPKDISPLQRKTIEMFAEQTKLKK